MDRILLLNNEYPNRFDAINVVPPAGVTKAAYAETRIISALNSYNPKLHISHIEYLDIQTQFPSFFSGKSNGALIEEFDIDSRLADVYRNKGCYVNTVGTRTVCRRILMYIFISEPNEDTRTAFVSQTVFPYLLDYAEKYIMSPSYTVANHKFCLINIVNKQITSLMIRRHLASLCVAGVDYVEAFNQNTIDPGNLPITLKAFLETYARDYNVHYDAVLDVYEDDNYRVEFANKVFYMKAAPMVASKIILKPNGFHDFHGSSEKFYWIEQLPVVLFAYNQGFKVDYSDYKAFVTTYRTMFNPNSDKFSRCETLLLYLDKYII